VPFELHPSVLERILFEQACTLEQAIMEMIMNAIDAGAGQIHITTTLDTDDNVRVLSVRDDGQGFDEQEAERVFRTIGLPHTKEEDEGRGTKFGKFRMGRGQLFRFGRNTWESGHLVFEVDVKNKGTGFQASKASRPVSGCCVTLEMYEDKDQSGYNLKEDLLKRARYLDTHITLNGEPLGNGAPDQDPEGWDLKDQDFFFRVDHSSSYVRVYNQGVLINPYDSIAASLWTTGGVFASRRDLVVNLSRNSWLHRDCPVAKKAGELIRSQCSGDEALAALIGQKARMASSAKDWQDLWRACDLLRRNRKISLTRKQRATLQRVQFLRDVLGKVWSFRDLYDHATKSCARRVSDPGSKRAIRIVLASADNRTLAEGAARRGEVVVLDPDIYDVDLFGGDPHGHPFASLISLVQTESGRACVKVLIGRDDWLDQYMDRSADQQNRVLLLTELTGPELAWRDTVQMFAHQMFGSIAPDYRLGNLDPDVKVSWEALGSDPHYLSQPTRLARMVRIELGEAHETGTVAWTDGDRMVVFDREAVKKYFGRVWRVSTLQRIWFVLLHEYAHAGRPESGHDFEFYYRFHSLVVDSMLCQNTNAFDQAVKYMARKIVQGGYSTPLIPYTDADKKYLKALESQDAPSMIGTDENEN